MTIRPEKVAAVDARLEALGVRPQDLEERFVRARGPGGQKVNKTSSAVQLKHLPSGIEVKADRSRSQTENRFFARRQLVEELEAKKLGKDAPAIAKAKKLRKQKNRRRRRTQAKQDGSAD